MTNPDLTGGRLSSSLPLPSWTGLPNSFRYRHRLPEPSLTTPTSSEEPLLARRASALSQLNGFSNARLPPLTPRLTHRHSTSTPGRLSSLHSNPNPAEPVLVRPYTPTQRRPRMTMTVSGSAAPPSVTGGPIAPPAPVVPLPPPGEFSIDGILRAIEPEIQSTLDAIAEICGRSKLSLANEYGSHRPPLGEIRVPRAENGLLPVEEASSSNERLDDTDAAANADAETDDNERFDDSVVIMDDVSVDGHDHYFSFGFLDNPETEAEASGVIGYRSPMLPAWPDPFLSRRPTISQRQSRRSRTAHSSSLQTRVSTPGPGPVPTPTSAPVQAPPQARSSSLFDLAKFNNINANTNPIRSHPAAHDRCKTSSTQPVVTQVLLCAQPDGSYHWTTSGEPWADLPLPNGHDCENDSGGALTTAAASHHRQRLSFLASLRDWLSSVQASGHRDAPPQLQLQRPTATVGGSRGKMGKTGKTVTAEGSLRGVLKRHQEAVAADSSGS